jgi:hypothetical protein
MHTHKNFSELPKNEQVYQLFRNGKELFVKRNKNFIVRLFALSGIFVEIWYDNRQNRIERIEVIDEDQLLNTYQDELNIGELINN